MAQKIRITLTQAADRIRENRWPPRTPVQAPPNSTQPPRLDFPLAA